MKKLVLVVLAVLISSISYSQSGWVRVTDSISNFTIYGIQFTSENIVYAIGANPYTTYFLKSTNGGLNWQNTQLSDFSAYNIYFINDNTGFIGGAYGGWGYCGIFKTTNGGTNWIKKDSVYAIFDIEFYDYNTGYVVAKYSQIKKTTNGGENWFIQTGVDWSEPTSLCCIDANTWLVSNGLGKINKTTNGGLNWSVLDFSTAGVEIFSLSFVNITTGYGSSWSGGLIFKTTNTGNNWNQICDINYPGLWNECKMQFVNETTGYLGGSSDSGCVFKTTNGGYNWIVQKEINKTIWALDFINPNTGFVGGAYGVIFKTTNGGSVFVSHISSEVPEKYSLSQNYPNPFNPTTKIKFDIAKFPSLEGYGFSQGVGMVTLIVYDIMGREVQILVNERLQPGTYEATFDASSLTSGVYFYKLTTNDFTETKKMILLK